MKQFLALAFTLMLSYAGPEAFAGQYKNFRVSVYARAYEVRDMGDTRKLDSLWGLISRQVKVDKIYLETHRDKILVDAPTIEAAKKFFSRQRCGSRGWHNVYDE
jgi:hypothetical protein